MSEPPAELRLLIDDPVGVLDTDSVLRVVQPQFFKGRDRQSNAYQDQSIEVANSFGLADACTSVNVKRIWQDEGADVEALLAGFAPGSGIVEISVAALRGLTSREPPNPIPQGVMLDPRLDRPWHAVTFAAAGGTKTRAMRRAIDDVATWFWHPDLD